MSRYYEMHLRVHGANPDRVDGVKNVAAEEWSFDGWYPLGSPDNPTSFVSSGEGRLCAGVAEEEFAESLARAIWEANGGYCEVEVRATYLENLPCETYSFDEEAFEELAGKNGKAAEAHV